ncbi:hypothetical protein RGUI_1880 [Rhodovulum sp. P5]|nr:hypothetical protein RGUI_1880 [Rhodovulum sp. P5]
MRVIDPVKHPLKRIDGQTKAQCRESGRGSDEQREEPELDLRRTAQPQDTPSVAQRYIDTINSCDGASIRPDWHAKFASFSACRRGGLPPDRGLA